MFIAGEVWPGGQGVQNAQNRAAKFVQNAKVTSNVKFTLVITLNVCYYTIVPMEKRKAKRLRADRAGKGP